MKKHLARAARLYEAASRHDSAEEVYAKLVELDPTDRSAAQALVRVKKTLGKYEELIESLLEQSESSESSSERAEHWAEIGQLYENELKDKEQALVAYAQAFCEDPLNESHAAARGALGRHALPRLGRRARTSHRSARARISAPPNATRCFSTWVVGTPNGCMRPDLALPWLTQLVAAEPNHDPALLLLAQIYKKAQQWAEYGQVLLRRADVAAPNLARDLRVEAAEVLASRLNNAAAARELYAAVLEEDPGHEKASARPSGAARRRGRCRGRAARAANPRQDSARGRTPSAACAKSPRRTTSISTSWTRPRRPTARCSRENPHFVDALRGLDRVLTRAGRYRELLDVLRAQIDLAVTARQKITLYERIAGVYDEEYLDHERAAEALRNACSRWTPSTKTRVANLRAISAPSSATKRWPSTTSGTRRAARSSARSKPGCSSVACCPRI